MHMYVGGKGVDSARMQKLPLLCASKAAGCAIRRLESSGIGKEGPRCAVEAMTGMKTMVFHGLAS